LTLRVLRALRGENQIFYDFIDVERSMFDVQIVAAIREICFPTDASRSIRRGLEEHEVEMTMKITIPS
jgi:hypothetical protein